MLHISSDMYTVLSVPAMHLGKLQTWTTTATGHIAQEPVEDIQEEVNHSHMFTSSLPVSSSSHPFQRAYRHHGNATSPT